MSEATFSPGFRDAVKAAPWEQGTAAIVPGPLARGVMCGAHNYVEHFAGPKGTERFAADVARLAPKLKREQAKAAILAFLDERAPHLKRAYP